MYFDKIKLLLRRLITIVVMHRWVLHRYIVQGNEFGQPWFFTLVSTLFLISSNHKTPTAIALYIPCAVGCCLFIIKMF